MARRKRVLVVTESRNLATGFGTYAVDLMRRLHATQKYDLAELACYARSTDFNNSPWPVYGALPLEGEEKYEQLYNQYPPFQWGLGRFDDVALHFKPDVVLTYRDPWNDRWIIDSPFFPMFRWVWMVTCDSAPQKPEWLHVFEKCDTILAYSEYGIRAIEGQTHQRLKVAGCASPGVDFNTFQPIPNKRQHKEKHGISPDSFIIGTVMRNQKRKMFAELIRTFAHIKSRIPNAYLLLHTNFPEKMGWQIANLVSEFGVANRVLMTYKCRHCQGYSVLPIRDALSLCPKCEQYALVLAGVSHGCTRQELAEIYNLMDIYVQYAICEGFGMCQVEAGACGVPIVAVNYSAMEDVVKNLDGIPLEPYLIRELEGNADRSGPNNEQLAEILIKLSQKVHTQEWNEKRLDVRYATMKRYTWDNAINTWCDAIDNLDYSKNLSWGSPPLFNELPDAPPEGLNTRQLIEWLFYYYLQDKTEFFNYRMMQSLAYLNLGVEFGPGFANPITADDIINQYRQIGSRKVSYDKVRCGAVPYRTPDFIIEAEKRTR